MKKLLAVSTLALATAFLLPGCAVSIGNQDGARRTTTVGQQLVDLQKARDAGAISDAEYQNQKAKLLGEK